jgi:FkbM family methyltransferase
MIRSWNSRRFTLLEVGLILLFAGTVVYVSVAESYEHTPEALQLRAIYGPGRETEHEEEWIIRDFFKDRKNGFFLDVGASHYRQHSNTYYLETKLEWSGIAVEPLRAYESDYITHRPRTRFRPFFVSDVSNDSAKMYVLPSNPLVTSGHKEFTSRRGKDVEEVVVPTITLSDLLDTEKVASIDFLSMDIELWEPKALVGFDIDRFKPSLVCIESHPEVRQQILEYFARHSYVVLGKYLRADTANLYFAPLR